MVGGLAGIIVVIRLVVISLGALLDKNEFLPIIFFIAFIGISTVLYLLSFWAGLLLWRQQRLGYRLTMITQILQIPVLSSTYLSYSFLSGLQLKINIGAITGIFYHIGSEIILGHVPSDPFSLGINLVPLFFLWKVNKNNN